MKQDAENLEAALRLYYVCVKVEIGDLKIYNSLMKDLMYVHTSVWHLDDFNDK